MKRKPLSYLLKRPRSGGIDREREDDLAESGPVADVEFLVTNMVCEGCAEKISAALTAVPGVREVRSKVSQKHIYVQYEPGRVRKEQIKETVVKTGFTAVEA